MVNVAECVENSKGECKIPEALLAMSKTTKNVRVKARARKKMIMFIIPFCTISYHEVTLRMWRKVDTTEYYIEECSQNKINPNDRAKKKLALVEVDRETGKTKSAQSHGGNRPTDAATYQNWKRMHSNEKHDTTHFERENSCAAILLTINCSAGNVTEMAKTATISNITTNTRSHQFIGRRKTRGT